MKKIDAKTLDAMREVYRKYGIDIHEIPNSLQSQLNALIKDFIKCKELLNNNK